MRTSGRANRTLGWPDLHRAGPRGGKKKTQKEKPKGQGPVSPVLMRMQVRALSLSPRVFCVGMPSCLEDVFSFHFLNKTEV